MRSTSRTTRPGVIRQELSRGAPCHYLWLSLGKLVRHLAHEVVLNRDGNSEGDQNGKQERAAEGIWAMFVK